MGETPIDLESYGEFEHKVSAVDKNESQFSNLKAIWQHSVETSEVLERLAVDHIHGLDQKEAEKRLAKHGQNTLTPPLQKPLWQKLLSHFTDFFSILLQLAALLCFVAFLTEPTEILHLYLGCFLFLVVISTSLFSFFQRYKSDKILREFKNFMPQKARVKRDGGKIQTIDASKLVVGDIVMVKVGDKIPADLRILESSKFTVDNSSLTGESIPIELNSDKSISSPLESINLAFFGCSAVDGFCTAVVIATGDFTVFGEIARLTTLAEEEQGQTTLQSDIEHFVVNISIFSIIIGIIFFIVGVVKGTGLVHNLVYSIGIIVSNIPEGLLATVTVALTASARRMLTKQVLVKKLDSIETLGSTTTICSDKTGTLTQNRMNVSHVAYGGRVEVVHSKWMSPELADVSAEEQRDHLREAFNALLYGASICSTAEFDSNPGETRRHVPLAQRAICGDASEAGILRFTSRLHPVEEYRRRHDVVAIIPFNSRNKYMVTVHQRPTSDQNLKVTMKGAPEKVLERCSQLLSRDGIRQMNERDFALIQKQIKYLAGRGERVFAFAEKELSPQRSAEILLNPSNPSVDNLPCTNLCFVGLLSLLDPPRDEVHQAVQTCRNAGIRVIMVTGDHEDTARSIGQHVGVITKAVAGHDESPRCSIRETAIVVNGADLHDATAARWAEILAHEEIVFARTSPHQKLQIVEHLQQRGEIVTVTGDGCNDAPALKQANTGVAMGISGSDVSREAADIIVLDDNFASIVDGVEEGRLIFDNLKKSIAYTLTSNVPQLIPFLVFVTLQIPLPLTTVLVLCIDLGTDIFPAIALAYEDVESNIMQLPPRNAKKHHLVNTRLVSYASLQLGAIQTFAGFFAFLTVFQDYGLGVTSLLGINRQGYFGTESSINSRWLYSIQRHQHAAAYKAGWFSQTNPEFVKYFQSKQQGFLQQKEEQFAKLPPKASNSTLKSSSQLQNMVKMIGFVTSKPACFKFSCTLSNNQQVADDPKCFNPLENKGGLVLAGLRDGSVNTKVVEGRGEGTGCFNLWTPSIQREILKRAQTSFFVSIVVTQIFTLLVCRTRTLSLFHVGIFNFVILGAISVEVLLSVFLVYFPPLKHGFNVRPIRALHWLLGLPFGIFIIIYDEVRKYFIRGHLDNETGMNPYEEGPVTSFSKWVHDFTLW